MNSTPQDATGLPQYPKSLWKDTTSFPSFPALQEDIQTDVLIAGAGITGITAAYLLVKAGLSVAVVDAGNILDGTTGYTTAKITSQHGMIYDSLISHFGEEAARLYFEANEEALRFMDETVREHRIDCQFKREDAYLYADSEEQLTQLKNEWAAYEKLNLPGKWEDALPLPVEALGAIRMPDQARFHPLQYLRTLVDFVSEHGGKFYENSTVADSAEEMGDGKLLLKTESGVIITCRHAISASHYPFFDGGGLYFTRLHADRSYAVAIEPETPFEGGMYINCGNPKRSLRAAEFDGKQLILVGGESHKTGQSDCTIKHYEELEKFGGLTFGIKSIPYRWSAQDLVTIDQVPYIGPVTSDHPRIYVATGFAKWGMTSGTLSALLLSDLIQGKENRYADLFTPSRFKANPSIKNIAVQNVDVAKQLIAGKVEIIHRRPEELGPDEGGTVRHLGKRAGAYRDPDGHLHLVDTTCTHMGCECNWNQAERTWDCPCHGSRFDHTGAVIEGPATENLKPLSAQ
ncbi:oxidoreductase [Paenibacillus faecis]|uniref:FAD-dependent oxidoreductase n=1 Tax=Paenibacillus faecis TaxID=862114 RepID=A0A5D0CQ98_9BACL|nr:MULTISPECIES: FAD-dependent oxidoreductase [Paenibacillus]MCA1294095.1 FAD-dependent oxidoreductase [Paenibacillus sp. alder61]TYA11972.1 FAD-dependent oxidoreductase [Paenibacillus faecis]GIO86463.1 oxidoreductase [Paenibacillus faecis]